MVKGITKQVVVVKCPDTKYFDQAIFMVKEGSLDGLNPEGVLKEACRVADEYIRNNTDKKSRVWPYYLGAGIGMTALGLLLLLIM